MRGRVEREGILRACVSMNAGLIVSGGVYRLLADTFGFAGALSIKLIVDAMSEGTAETEVTTLTCGKARRSMDHNFPPSLLPNEFHMKGQSRGPCVDCGNSTM